MEIYALIAGITLYVLGFLMIFGLLGFLIDRYEWFQKLFRKKEFSVDRESLSKFYSMLYFALGTPLIIGAIIGLINSDISILFYIWLFVAVAALGLIGILYCNVTKRFLIFDQISA